MEGTSVDEWKKKEAALRIFMCLVQIPDTSAVAAIQDFVTNHLEPLFHGPDWSSLPLLMAGTLRSLVVFKDELTKDTALKLLRRAANFLQHDSDVVCFYAASFVKDLLSKNSGASNMAIVAASDLNNSDTINVLMKNLVNALDFPNPVSDPYLLKCLIVVLGIADPVSIHSCVAKLVQIVKDICITPQPPNFTHYLFESLSTAFGELINKYQAYALAVSREIIHMLCNSVILLDITECWNYSFQVLAQIIGSASVTLEDQFLISIVDVVLGNVNKRDRRQSLEAMVLVLRGALKRIPYRLYEQNKLKQILSVAAELCAANTTHHAGFQIFNSFIEMDTSLVMKPLIPNIFNLIFSSLDDWMHIETVRKVAIQYRKSLVLFTALVIVTYGLDWAVSYIGNASKSAGLEAGSMKDEKRALNSHFLLFVRCYWSPNFHLMEDEFEVKVTAVACSNLFLEHKDIWEDPVWFGESLDQIVGMFSSSQVGAQGMQVATEQVTSWFNDTSSRDHDLLSGIDPKLCLVQVLAQIQDCSCSHDEPFDLS